MLHCTSANLKGERCTSAKGRSGILTTSEITLEQRRIDTWKAIHQAAAELALKDGLAHSTIDAIANHAGISRRTFFNYFPTKEDAVLGLGPPEVPADALATFQAVEDDLLAGLVHFMVTVLRTSYRLSPNSSVRRQLIERFPELRFRQTHYAGLVESMIAPVLYERLSASSGTALDDDDSKAAAMLMLARTIVQFAYSRQPAQSAMTVSDIDAAIIIFRNILKDTV